VVCDCEVIMYGDDVEIMLYDCLYFNKSLTNQHFISRYNKLKEIKLHVDKVSFSLQIYFPVDMIGNRDYGEGLVFTRVDVSYCFGLSSNVIFMKNSKPTLDFKYMKGGLYSAYYKKDRSLDKYVLEGKVSWSSTEGIIVEVRLEKDGFRLVRTRYDKKMPNSSFTVKDLLTKDRAMMMPDIFKATRSMKTFYTRDYTYTLYKRECECIQIYFKGKRFFFYRNNRLSLVNLYTIQMLQDRKSQLVWVNNMQDKYSSLIYYLFYQEKKMLTRYKLCPVHDIAFCCVEYYHKDNLVDSMFRCVFEYDNHEEVVRSVYLEIEKNYEMKVIKNKVIISRISCDVVDEVVIDY